MGTRDPRVDAYIAKAPEFARPILTTVRATVHAAVPDVEETIKWGAPHFDYKGMLLGMASFKHYAAIHFWKEKLIFGKDVKRRNAELGRFTTPADLPPNSVLAGYLKKAAALNDAGVKIERERREPKPPLRVPADLASALKKNAKAHTVFTDFSPSKKRDYVEWITGAKTGETRSRRLAQAIEWIGAGKSRNWKYEKVARS
jgi:uncharacterized protein YdeI (YjbR/CyaY-like superfamily)